MAALAALAVVWFASGETPAVTAPEPSRGDCQMIGVWSNGYHTSLSVPADLFDADHPLRRLYPNATHLMIGWGDLAFYRSKGDDLLLGLEALAPGGQSGMHVLGGVGPVEGWYIGKEVLPVALSTRGARGLATYITDSMVIGADGSAAVVAYEQGGVFLKARKDFHAFNVCNHWTMRALRSAGVRVNAALSFTGDIVIDQLKKPSQRACPT